LLRCSLTLISILAAALAGCGGFEASPVPTGDDAFLGGAGGWDESDRLLGMTPEQAAEVMDGHWVDDPSLEAPVLVSNDALLLDGLPCFETASFDGESRVFASFSCSPESQGVAEGVILITGGADGFRRRIAELHVAGDDLVAETEPVTLDEIYLVAQFRKQLVVAAQPLSLAPPSESGARELTVNANWTVYDQKIGGLDHRVKLGGTAVLRGVMDFDFDIRLCSAGWLLPPVPCADYRAAVGLDTELQLRLILELGKAFNWGSDYPLPFDVPVATFPLAGLPVVVSLDLQPSLFWQVRAEAKVVSQIGVEADMLAMIGVGGTVPGLVEDLSGVEFSNARLQDPRFDEVISARARVGFKYAITATFNETLDLVGSVSPYLQAVAKADCDEIDLALQHGVETRLGISLGWGPLNVNANWNVGGLGPYDIFGTSVPLEDLLTFDSDCVGDDDPGVPTAETFLPELPHHQASTSEQWFQDHLGAMDQALADYSDALDDLHDGEPNLLLRDVVFSTDGMGYWTLDEDGGVEAFGSAVHHCDMPEELIDSHEPQGLVPQPHGDGYWIYTGAGRVMSCSFGEVDNEQGLMGHGEQAVVDMVAAPGGGYWLLEADGTVHAFDGAPNHGSVGDDLYSAGDRAVALVSVPGGYRIATLRKDVFDFGAVAPFGSSDRAVMLDSTIHTVADMVALPDGGLLFVDGGGHLHGLDGADEDSWEGWAAVDNPQALSVTPSGLGGVVLSRDGTLAAWGEVPQ